MFRRVSGVSSASDSTSAIIEARSTNFVIALFSYTSSSTTSLLLPAL